MRILDGGNLKMAEAILAHRIQQRIEQQQAIAQQNSQMNSQVQQESIAAQAQAAQAQLGMQTNADIMKINAQADADIRVDNNKLAQTKDIEIIKSQGKIQQGANKDQTDLTKKVIESNTNIQKENIKAEAASNKQSAK